MTLQYRTIVEGAGSADALRRGFIGLTGRDAVSFLHALVTNDVEGLVPGRGAYAAWLTPQGRMMTDLLVLRTDVGVLVEVPETLAASLTTRLDQLVFSEDVRIEDLSQGVMPRLVVGGAASKAIADATAIDVTTIDALPLYGHVESQSIRVVRTDDTRLPTFVVWVPNMRSEDIFAKLPPKMTSDLMSGLRIEAGRPLFGVDMTSETIPLEAGLLDRAISQTKGCYVGQEVIVRVLHRGGGRVVKNLVQVSLDVDGTSVPSEGAALKKGGQEVGAITSAAFGPESGRIVALGYVHRDASAIGTQLDIDGTPGLVTALAG